MSCGWSSCTAAATTTCRSISRTSPAPNEWIGAVAGVSNPHFIAQSVDAAGNIGTTSNKAVLHEANGQGAEFGITFDGPVGDNGWYTATPEAILIGDVDPADVGVSVNGGAPVPYPQFALPAADGVYDIVASTDSTTVETTAKVDHTAPTITTNPTITISTVFQVGQAVTLAVNCTDPGAPNSSGVASCAPSSVTLDTTSPGTRSFTGTATDNAGNSRTQTFTYVVAAAYRYTNVFPYTDRLNVVRAGWFLPLIFKAYGPTGAQITTTAFTTTISAPQKCPSLTQSQLSQSSMANNTSNLLVLRPGVEEHRVDLAHAQAHPERGQAVLPADGEGHRRHRARHQLVGEAHAVAVDWGDASRASAARRPGGTARSARSGDRRGRRRAVVVDGRERRVELLGPARADDRRRDRRVREHPRDRERRQRQSRRPRRAS